MLTLVLSACLLGVSLALPTSTEEYAWSAFKLRYNRNYQLGADEYRKGIFISNLRLVESHNRLADQGLTTYRLGINNFADLTTDEFRAMLNGYRVELNSSSAREQYVPTIQDDEIPDSVDWRPKGYVTPVKNQGQCGSCWAFSATGSLEGQHFKSTGKLVSLSEQNLIDCSKKEGDMGCEGGLMDNAFKYIKREGIDTEASYPYTAKNGRVCKFRRNDVGAKLHSWKDIKKGNEKDLQKAVAEIGPISVAIDASHASFQLYKSGVYSERACSSSRLDHGVLAVGYGEAEAKFWLVKNSWGADWGMAGYIQMSRDKENQCGIATQASYPIV